MPLFYTIKLNTVADKILAGTLSQFKPGTKRSEDWQYKRIVHYTVSEITEKLGAFDNKTIKEAIKLLNENGHAKYGKPKSGPIEQIKYEELTSQCCITKKGIIAFKSYYYYWKSFILLSPFIIGGGIIIVTILDYFLK